MMAPCGSPPEPELPPLEPLEPEPPDSEPEPEPEPDPDPDPDVAVALLPVPVGGTVPLAVSWTSYPQLASAPGFFPPANKPTEDNRMLFGAGISFLMHCKPPPPPSYAPTSSPVQQKSMVLPRS